MVCALWHYSSNPSFQTWQIETTSAELDPLLHAALCDRTISGKFYISQIARGRLVHYLIRDPTTSYLLCTYERSPLVVQDILYVHLVNCISRHELLVPIEEYATARGGLCWRSFARKRSQEVEDNV
jgi:hypothetical protein